MKLKDTVHRGLGLKLGILGIFLVILWYTSGLAEVDLGYLVGNTDQMMIVFGRLLNPDWTYLDRIVPALIETLQMAITGTVIGVLLALPVSFLSTTAFTKNPYISWPFRGLLNIIRTIPDLLLAALFVAVFGIGTFTGMLTIAIFTFGMLTKLFYETIETIDQKPLESLMSVGGNKAQIARFGIMPQIMPNVISYTLYALEINVRASTVLGYVGAGGIGLTLQHAMSLLRYDRVSIIIIVILAAVLIIDGFSTWVRRRYL